MNEQKNYPIDKINKPLQKIIQNEKAGGIVLGISVIIAVILANSPFSNAYHHFFEHKIGIQFDGKSYLEYSLHHWINDGLMAVFFFVVGLELKKKLSEENSQTQEKHYCQLEPQLEECLFRQLFILC